jgi:hypothetical protein
LEVDDFLPVACRVIHDKKGYVPRDVQLTAVVAFVSSDNQQQQAGRMPHCHDEWDKSRPDKGRRSSLPWWPFITSCATGTRIDTSTRKHYHEFSRLGRGQHRRNRWLFQAFGVSVSNNCDQICSNNDDVRRTIRYNDITTM